jgi:hypothetical protein
LYSYYVLNYQKQTDENPSAGLLRTLASVDGPYYPSSEILSEELLQFYNF